MALSWLEIGSDDYNVYKVTPVGDRGWLLAGFTRGYPGHGDRIRTLTFVKGGGDMRLSLMKMAENATD